MITAEDVRTQSQGGGSWLDELIREDRMHRRLYVDPAVFELELGRIFYRVWVFVGHESEVPNPGDFKTTHIGRQPVIMVRHSDGQVHVLFNRCSHRGAVVCREERGNAAHGFRCLYHGWTFATDGELTGVPYQAGYSDEYFHADELALGHAPHSDTYRGFVFACLAPDAEPLIDSLGRATHYLDAIVDRAPQGRIAVTKGIQKYAYRGNWKLQIENFTDSYHPAFTHESAFDRFRARTGQQGAQGDRGSENVYLGNGHSMIDYAAGARSNLAIYPNLLFQSARQHFRVVRPVRVDYTEVFAYPYRLEGAPDEANDEQVRTVSVWAGAAGLGQPDDVEAFERVQEGLQVESMEWVLFNRGLHRERVEPSGEVRGFGADEVSQRGQHREYKRLMLRA